MLNDARTAPPRARSRCNLLSLLSAQVARAAAFAFAAPCVDANVRQ